MFMDNIPALSLFQGMTFGPSHKEGQSLIAKVSIIPSLRHRRSYFRKLFYRTLSRGSDAGWGHDFIQ